ncbi:MAG: hypothetical protein QW172_05500 [Candidatus Bathyarchaeia archaeon]
MAETFLAMNVSGELLCDLEGVKPLLGAGRINFQQAGGVALCTYLQKVSALGILLESTTALISM